MALVVRLRVTEFTKRPTSEKGEAHFILISIEEPEVGAVLFFLVFLPALTGVSSMANTRLSNKCFNWA
jgi:hypothetical protein